ncbi:MAG: copper amine oxidase N-terminal domain-containing protein [Desulfitobacteriaceae bacterium]|nr:copper amine oxidase N-terminal domain-containing protein [Desulfitobacteriaceae bacterium]
MKTLKLVLGFLICLLFLGLAQDTILASPNKDIEVYLDGQKVQLDLAPAIFNGRVVLPLRATFNLFDTPVDWDYTTKSITANIGDQKIKLIINQNQAIIPQGLGTDILLEQSPVMIANSVFVPIQFIAQIFNAEVQWEKEAKKIILSSPLIFKNDQWYINDFDNNSLIPVEKYKYSKNVKQGNIIYSILHIGDNTVGMDFLYSLDDKGKFKQIFSGRIRDYQIEGDYCYYIGDSIGYINLGTLIKVKLSTPLEKVVLGEKGFAYGSQVQIRKGNEDNNIYFSLSDDAKWQVKSDGIYIIAYNTKMNLEDRVIDFPLLEKSHGYYLVDKNGYGQKLVKRIKV